MICDAFISKFCQISSQPSTSLHDYFILDYFSYLTILVLVENIPLLSGRLVFFCDSKFLSVRKITLVPRLPEHVSQKYQVESEKG